MMKKLGITILCVIALCALLSVTAFAEELPSTLTMLHVGDYTYNTDDLATNQSNTGWS